MDNNPSIISHVSIGTNNFERAIAAGGSDVGSLGEREVCSFK